MPKTLPHGRLRRTPNGSTRTFGHSSARSNRHDAAREASCTSMEGSVSDSPMAASLASNLPRTAYPRENQSRTLPGAQLSCWASPSGALQARGCRRADTHLFTANFAHDLRPAFAAPLNCLVDVCLVDVVDGEHDV